MRALRNVFLKAEFSRLFSQKRKFLSVKTREGECRTLAQATAGFTLVEMLVVLAIIGLLVGLVAPRVLGQLSDAKVKTAHIQIESFKNALDLYFLDAGHYPTTNEGLNALAVHPSNQVTWNGPYLKGGAVPRDPWNNAYIYRSPGQNNRPYEILSYGASGREGGEGAAITSW
jgi:general secretion pathway protein G